MASLGGAMIDHDHDRAAALLNRAEGLARGYYPGTEDAEPLRAILEAFLEADRDRAVRLATDLVRAAERIPHAAGKDSALFAIAAALADLHHWEQADRAAASVTSPVNRAQATRALAEALARDGQWDRG